MGCHPTRSKQFEQFHGGANAYLNALDRLIGQNLEGNGRVVAIGECGLGIYSTICHCELKFTSSRGDRL